MGDYSTKENVLPLSTLDPELAKVFENVPMMPGGFTDLPIEILRQNIYDLEKDAYEKCASLDTDEQVSTIRMRDGHENEIRVYRPTTSKGDAALVVLIYGGGFLAGTNMQLVPYTRAISAIYGATTITVSYRLAPPHAFPTAADDIWDALRWIAANHNELGADASKGFVLGGIWASVPVVTVNSEGMPEKYRDDWVSRTQNGLAPYLSSNDIEHATAFIQVAGMDPLRDDGLIYERYLRDHGVKTRLEVYPGVPHLHFTVWPNLELSKKYRFDVLRGFGWLFGVEVDDVEIRKVAGDALELGA